MNLFMAAGTKGSHVARFIPAATFASDYTVSVGRHPGVAANLARLGMGNHVNRGTTPFSFGFLLKAALVMLDAVTFRSVGAWAPWNATGKARNSQTVTAPAYPASLRTSAFVGDRRAAVNTGSVPASFGRLAHQRYAASSTEGSGFAFLSTTIWTWVISLLGISHV